MLYLTGKGLNTSESWYLGNINPSIWLGVDWFGKAMWDISTSALCLTLVLEREAQLSVDVFMRTNTLQKKNLKKCRFVFLFLSHLKSPSGLKIYSTCVNFYVLKPEVLNIPCCKNKPWILRGFFFYVCTLMYL